MPSLMRLFGRPLLWGPVSNVFALLTEGCGARWQPALQGSTGRAGRAPPAAPAPPPGWQRLTAPHPATPCSPAGFLAPPAAFPSEFGPPLAALRHLLKQACAADADLRARFLHALFDHANRMLTELVAGLEVRDGAWSGVGRHERAWCSATRRGLARRF